MASQLLTHRAWDGLGTGALFTTRTLCTTHVQIGSRGWGSARRTRGTNAGSLWPSHRTLERHPPPASWAQWRLSPALAKHTRKGWGPTGLGSHGLSQFHSSAVLAKSQQQNEPRTTQRSTDPAGVDVHSSAVLAKSQQQNESSTTQSSTDPADVDDLGVDTFQRTERAAQASKVNLSAKLSSGEGKKSDQQPKGGWREVVRLLKIAQPEWKPLTVAVVLLLISSSVSMSLPFSIGKIMDAAAQEQGVVFGMSMEKFCIGLGALLAAGAAANYGRIVLLRIVGEKIVSKLRSQLFKRTFIQNAEFFDANRVGDLISRLGSDTIIVGKSITQNASDGLRSGISASAGLALMAYMSFKLTGVLAFFTPPVAVAAFFYGRLIRNLSRKIQKNLGTLTRIAEERLGNVRTSQAFAGELQEVHRYNNQVRTIFSLGRREAFISATFFSTSGLMGNFSFLALLYVGGGMVQSGDISIGDLTSFLMYAGYAGGSLFGLSAFYSELMKGVGAASRLFELQDRNPTISPTKGDMVKSARGIIEFNEVAFAYPTRPAVEIFKNLSFRIEEGSNVCCVAPSGAGKSTIASMLLRFYDPTSGSITIAGKNIANMNAKQLRRKIGYVGQEPVLFSGTIAENIAYGRPAASRGDVLAAARQANCQFISDFVSGPVLWR